MVDHRARMTLADMPIGASANIVGYRDAAPVRRLAQMGFVPGRRVKAIRLAPLGDPVEYSVLGSRVAMRRSDAAGILVEPAPGAP